MREKINFDNAIYGEKNSNNSIIKVIGVGGGGGNAVAHMYENGIIDVNFLICNTDLQALEHNPIPSKLVLGNNGLGAGADPDKAREFAIESREQIREFIGKETKMLFITAGMGKGTGTGASPVIAEIAKEMGILTIGVVTYPFGFEGSQRAKQADKGINEIKRFVDSLIVVKNQNIMKYYRDQLVEEAFAHADDVLKNAVKCIAELVSVHAIQNVDFSDVEKAMKNSGPALLGLATANGADRIEKVTQEVFNCPLLDESLISNAKNLLFYISCGTQAPLTIPELEQLSETFDAYKSSETDVIWGRNVDADLGEDVKLAVIITNYTREKIHLQEEIILPDREEKESNHDLFGNNTPDFIIAPPIEDSVIIDSNNAILKEKIRTSQPAQTLQQTQQTAHFDTSQIIDDFEDLSRPSSVTSPQVISSFNDSKFENKDNFEKLINVPAFNRTENYRSATVEKKENNLQHSYDSKYPSDEDKLYNICID